MTGAKASERLQISVMAYEQILNELKEYIEWKAEESRADRKMYFEDDGKLWKDTDTLIACCRARENICDLILAKLERTKFEHISS